MKRTICILLTVLMVLGILAGCQKTPETPLVVGKNTEVMLEKAQATNSQLESQDNVAVDLYERLNAPKKYATDIVSKGGKLTVHVDANVELPDREIPIYRVRAAEFTLEQVRNFADALLGSNAHYIENDDLKTKAIYQKEIDKLRVALNDWDNVGQYMYDMVYNTRNDAEKALTALLIKADSAPEELPYYEPNFIWRKPNISTNEEPVETTDTYIMLYAMPDDTTISRLDVHNSLDFSGTATMRYWRDTSAMLGEVSTENVDVSEMLSISENDAFTLAKNTVTQMQLMDFECSGKQGCVYPLDPSGRRTKAVYDFMFTRKLNGVMETYTNDNESTIGGYSKPWQYEKIHVMVDDIGVFQILYSGPCEIVETIMGASSLMSFDEIKGIFEKMVVIVDNLSDSDVREYADSYVITTVRLGLISIREQDNGTGLLIPAWDFLGYTEYRNSKDEKSQYDTNELESFLTINAVDGSIIQRGNGY